MSLEIQHPRLKGLIFVALCALPGIGSTLLWLRGVSLIPLAAYGLMSLVCFIAYYRDKQFAIQGLQRTPEARLHLYELLGGWPGGLLAQRLIRHKNRKLSYQLMFCLIVLLHLSLAGLVLWLMNTPAGG